MKKEAISHGVLDDLANRNDNWDKLDGIPERVDTIETDATALELRVGKNETDITNLETNEQETQVKVAKVEKDMALTGLYTIPVNYLKVDGDGDFTFFLDIGNGEYSSHRFKRDTLEDFIKKYETSICELKLDDVIEVTKFKDYEMVDDGVMQATTTNNPYTSTIGTKITTTVQGSEIYGRFYKRYDGGMWKLSIDNNFIRNISVKSSGSGSGSVHEELLASNLEDVEHTVVFEFVGNDPSNPATTSDGVTPTTPRGWICRNTTNDNEPRFTFRYKTNELVKIGFVKKFDMDINWSNKEYAFEVADPTNTSVREWFPAHNGVGTTNTGMIGLQTMLLDNIEVDITKPSDYIMFNRAQFIQVMETRMSQDTDNRAITRLIVTAEDRKVYIDLEMKFLKETYMNNGYVFQMPMRSDYLKQIKSSAAEVVQSNVINLGTNTLLKNIDVNSFIATSQFDDKSSYYMKTDITEKGKDFVSVYLQHRDGGIQKLYPKPYSNQTFAVGDVIRWKGYYEVGRTPKAYLVYG